MKTRLLVAASKRAFTLVELIVTITILAILWTIAFISVENYTIYARDVVRVSDMSNMSKALDFTYAKTWAYPDVDNPRNIVFSGATIWTQWTFWTEVQKNTKVMSEIPLDPVLETEYTYSLTADKNEYELAGILEASNSISYVTDETYAIDGSVAYVIGNYNWTMLKTTAGWVDYVLAIPSIVTSDISVLSSDIKLQEDILDKNALVFDRLNNIPGMFNLTTGEVAFNPANVVVYSWDMANLSSETERTTLANNLAIAYTGTVAAEESNEILGLVSNAEDYRTAFVTNAIAVNHWWLQVPWIATEQIVSLVDIPWAIIPWTWTGWTTWWTGNCVFPIHLDNCQL